MPPLPDIDNVQAAQRIKDIAALSSEIEQRILKTLAPIDESAAPKEIRPLIHSINRLIAYFEDRSHHERDFSANASHELRTPLAGIRLQTEIAMNTDDKIVQNAVHQNILHAIDQNERLIEQLLILARLTADRVELSMEKTDLAKLAAHVVAELHTMAVSRQITLKLKPTKCPPVMVSTESVSILLHNLIRNAIYYSPSRSIVTIKINKINNNVVLSVIDTGSGIPEDKRKLVLGRFQKTGDNPKSGSGLGLSIVKRICDLHQATLELDSAKVSGKGLKVSVTFQQV